MYFFRSPVSGVGDIAHPATVATFGEPEIRDQTSEVRCQIEVRLLTFNPLLDRGGEEENRKVLEFCEVRKVD